MENLPPPKTGHPAAGEPAKVMRVVSVEEIEQIIESEEFMVLLTDAMRPHIILSPTSKDPTERVRDLLFDVFVKPSYDTPFEH